MKSTFLLESGRQLTLSDPTYSNEIFMSRNGLHIQEHKGYGEFVIMFHPCKRDIIHIFIGYVYRTETMRQLLCFKHKFPNHFAFTLERYLFLLFLV